MHDVPLTAADLAVGVFLRIQHRHIGVMKPVMRRHGRSRIMRRLVGAPKFAQLLVDVAVLGITRERARIVRAIFVPGFDFVCDDGCSLQSQAADKFAQPRFGGAVHEQFVRNPTDDLVPGRPITECRRSERHHREDENENRPHASSWR